VTNFWIFLTIIINTIFQSTILPDLRVFGMVPNTALVIIVILSLLKGRVYGSIVGLFVGFIQDVLFSSVLGVNAFIFFFVGYIIGFAKDSFARENIINPVIFSILGTIFYNILYSLFMFFLSVDITFIEAVRSVVSFEIVLNGIASIVIYKIFQKIYSQPKIRFSRNRWFMWSFGKKYLIDLIYFLTYFL